MNEVNPVAAVCDNEVRIYGSINARGRRPLMKVIQCRNRGQAVMYAQEHDDKEAERQVRRSQPRN